MKQGDQKSEVCVVWGWSGPGETPKAALGRPPRPACFCHEGQGPILQADPKKPALWGQGKGAWGGPNLP